MIKVPKIGSMMLATKAMSDQGVAPLMLLWKSFPILLLWLVPKIGFYWVIIMESSIAQMMGESDRHHPISTTLFKKSKSPTNKKREYICYTYIVSQFFIQIGLIFFKSISNDDENLALFFSLKKILLIIYTQKVFFTYTHCFKRQFIDVT